MSLPMRGAWIEISKEYTIWYTLYLSLPMRGAWIEILEREDKNQYKKVAPHAGSVD